MIDEGAAHGRGGEGGEVDTVFDVDAGTAGELHVGLMDKGGGGEGVVGTLLAEEACGLSAQVIVQTGEERLGGFGAGSVVPRGFIGQE